MFRDKRRNERSIAFSVLLGLVSPITFATRSSVNTGTVELFNIELHEKNDLKIVNDSLVILHTRLQKKKKQQHC